MRRAAGRWRTAGSVGLLSLPLLLPMAVVPALAGPVPDGAPRQGTGTGSTAAAAGDEDVTLGDGRRYRLHVGSGLPAGAPAPAVVVLHGLGSEAGDVEIATGFSRVADERGLLVAYPVGLWRSWNAGTCCGTAAARDVDDVGFLTQVVADLRRRGATEVTVVGFSNGGMMAYRLGCERPDVVRRVGVVAGSIQVRRCDADLDVVHVHGLDDDRIPYAGTRWSTAVAGPVRPAADVLRLVPGGGVRLLAVRGLGHLWPRAADGAPVDATAELTALAVR